MSPSLEMPKNHDFHDEDYFIDFFVKSNLKNGLVTIWSLDKQSVNVKNLLENINIEYQEIEVGSHPHKEFIIGALSMDNGFNLFPNIYFGKEHVGGFDDLKSYLSCEGGTCRLIR